MPTTRKPRASAGTSARRTTKTHPGAYLTRHPSPHPDPRENPVFAPGPGAALTQYELGALDRFFTDERRRHGQALAWEREQHGPLSPRVGALLDTLRRLDVLHARVKAHGGRGDIAIEHASEAAAHLHELKALHASML